MLAARLILPGAALVLAALVAPGSTRAGNGIHPRTPVLWEPAPACMTVVDRTVDAKLVMSYAIPYEDTELTADEVADSRRHQFLGFCRGHSRQEPLPVWLTDSDVAAAGAKSLIDPAMVDPEDVFATSTEWKDCWFRITGDDERRPITVEEAMKPVVWDTSLLPLGAYVISGYTWEPPFNIWSERSGVVKVIDDPDPAKNPPALALTNGEVIAYGNEVVELIGCLDAMDGSTISGFWSLTDADAMLDWQMFAGDVPVSGDSVELDFLPPPESHGQEITIKVVVTDPMDRSFTAHLGTLASILPPLADTGGCEDSGMAFIGDPDCGSTGGDPTSASVTGDGVTTGSPEGSSGASSAGSDATGAAEQPGVDRGCGCGLDGGSGPGGGGGAPAALLSGLLLVGRGRRARR